MKRVIVACAVLAVVLGIFACGEEGSGSSSNSTSPGSSPASKSTAQSGKQQPAKATPVEPTEPSVTPSQENALGAAASYLDYESFSKSGLEGQLKYEGYSAADAKFAATNVGANWNEQAAKAAKSYLEYETFSESSLTQQLEYEGFTPLQAEFGVSQSYR
jgi:hypothetical protein